MWRSALVILGLLVATAAAAPPRVEIRAQTKLVLDRVRLVGDDLAEVGGQLIDGLTGEGISGQPVTIRIGDATETRTTDRDGHFLARLAVPPGPQPVELAFRGGRRLSATQLSQVTDPARAQVGLTIDVEDAPGGLKVIVRATADDQPTQLAVALSIAAPGTAPSGPSGTPAFTSLAQVASGTPYLLTRKAAGGAGTRRLRAEFAGDDTRQAAKAEKSVELTAASTTTLALSANRIAYEDDLGVTGKVADEDGRPIPRAAVTLTAAERRLAQGATAEDGSYHFRVEGEILGQGQWGLVVQADPGTPAIRPSRSAPEVVRVSAPQPVPVSYTIAAFLATACAAGGFFAARARPWQRLRRPAPPAEVAASHVHDEPVDGGLVVAKPGLVSTLRRASDDGFSGVVRDTVRGRPVGDAQVKLRLEPLERAVTTGGDGGFTFEALAAGEWRAEVAAPGHVTESFVVSIPHRGELRGVRVDLVPVRERVFQLYRRAAEPILPEPRLWGVWSPRQIVDHVRSKRPTPALAELTSFVEEIYFSPRLADETVLPAASEQVDRAIRERASAAN
ncbi:MAG TPA: carboxypeptidase-like regulatory domain-containing protein [Kofleriaceae bacterium]